MKMQSFQTVSFKLVASVLLIGFWLSSCGYWPFIDYLVIKDFDPYSYTILKNQSLDSTVRLFTDSAFDVTASGKVWIPAKKRSKKLNVVIVDLYLQIKGSPSSSDAFWQVNPIDIVIVTHKGIQLKPTRVTFSGEEVKDYIKVKADENSSPNTHLIGMEFAYSDQTSDILNSHSLFIPESKLFINQYRYNTISPSQLTYSKSSALVK